MALLHYENLGVHRPDVLMRLAFSGLRDFYEYLKHTIAHLENADAVLRLAWRRASSPKGFRGETHGVWVELREPEDRPDEPDRTFDEFLDEDVREVLELQRTSDAKASGPGRVPLRDEYRISVLDRDPETCRLLLDREPRLAELCLRPNTSTLRRQRDALQQLQDAPAAAHLPLLRLFENTREARWPPVPPLGRAPQWNLLLDDSRPGTDAQREFVALALRTPDFAILEGPPGSGKTTAICELVLQLVEQGKRVLLCASTHVAVDNVLEKLGPRSLRDGSDLVPVRVGERRKISDGALPFQLEEIVRTERQRLLGFLQAKSPRSDAQEDLLRTLSRESNETSAIERMILDAANLVCGTTTGILRHPDVRAADASRRAGMFDVLILDEASKTTFQEFLVPALLARRWIIVGDARQLSPFVEDSAVAANLRAALPDEARRNACVDIFLAGHGSPNKRRATLVVDDRPEVYEAYRLQASGRGVEVRAPGEADAALADVVVGNGEAVGPCRDGLPADVGTVRGPADAITLRRAAAYRRGIQVRDDEPPCWEDELGWRLCRHFELRQARESATATGLRREIEALLPVGSGGERNGAAERVERVRRVAFPSVLESLQQGIDRPEEKRSGTALTDGLPHHVLAERHVLLEYQHRMHPDLSAWPRERVYGGTALKDPQDMAARRAWSYSGYQRRAVWVQVPGVFDRRNRNLAEVDAVVDELERFRLWARGNPRSRAEDGAAEPWEVAILTFYRGQERALRERLRRHAGERDAFRHFHLHAQGRVEVRVELCTVDRFQGHEADLVFLSLANVHATNFLESSNRMNVALTRARYQRVIVGNRERLRKRPGTLLGNLAENEHWERVIGGAR